MKIKLLIVAFTLLPLSGFALNSITGTPEGSASGNGNLEDNGYIFNVEGKRINGIPKDDPNYKKTPPDMGLFGSSNADGEWWVGNSSSAPWNEYVPDTTTGSRPNFHVTDDLAAGDEFYVGLSSQYESNGYLSEFRMVNANDIFSQDVDIYFGMQNVDGMSAASMAGDITTETGISYVDNTVPTNAGFSGDFQWRHYTSDSTSGAGDILFTIGASGDLKLTQWVVYFVLPSGMTTIDNEAWTDTPPAANDDLVFSWTISPKVGYTGWNGTTGVPPTTVSGWDNPSFNPVPEPSSVFLILSGAGLLLLRRSRKVA